MAVRCLSADDARVDFGDLAALDNLTELSVAFTLRPTLAVVVDRRMVSKWAGAANGFLLTTQDTNKVGFFVGGGAQYGNYANSTAMQIGYTYRVLCTYVGGSPGTMRIWINGVLQSLTNVLNGNVTSLAGNASAIQVGRQTAESIDPVDGDYSEVAIWGEAVPSWLAYAYGQGYSPTIYRGKGILYAPLAHAGQLQDLWGGVAGTHVAATSADYTPGRARTWNLRSLAHIGAAVRRRFVLVRP